MAFVYAVIFFVILLLLAVLGDRLGWIRSFVGDVLAVVWVYFLLKTLVRAKPALLAGIAFGTGVAVELMQYLMVSFSFQIPNRILRIVLGATPDWWDVLAYALGAMLVLGFEHFLSVGDRARG
ncbi:DUF2809 domain-containing protein [Rhizobium puerariae]|uniref:DUF2809 domain-containing protein n=1 Tax=Rhizobium puerariae TaxID=1585791 RepID=A0ABV6AEG4_9HYPH